MYDCINRSIQKMMVFIETPFGIICSLKAFELLRSNMVDVPTVRRHCAPVRGKI